MLTDFQYLYKKDLDRGKFNLRPSSRLKTGMLIFLWMVISVTCAHIDAHLLCLRLAWKTKKITHLHPRSTQKKREGSVSLLASVWEGRLSVFSLRWSFSQECSCSCVRCSCSLHFCSLPAIRRLSQKDTLTKWNVSNITQGMEASASPHLSINTPNEVLTSGSVLIQA